MSDPELSSNDREVLELWGWRSMIELPLVVEGRSVGLIEVADYRSSRAWSQRDIAFCQTIASQAAMAVRNAQLYEGLQEQADRDSADRPAQPPRVLPAAGPGAGPRAARRHAASA